VSGRRERPRQRPRRGRRVPCRARGGHFQRNCGGKRYFIQMLYESFLGTQVMSRIRLYRCLYSVFFYHAWCCLPGAAYRLRESTGLLFTTHTLTLHHYARFARSASSASSASWVSRSASFVSRSKSIKNIDRSPCVTTRVLQAAWNDSVARAGRPRSKSMRPVMHR